MEKHFTGHARSSSEVVRNGPALALPWKSLGNRVMYFSRNRRLGAALLSQNRVCTYCPDHGTLACHYGMGPIQGTFRRELNTGRLLPSMRTHVLILCLLRTQWIPLGSPRLRCYAGHSQV